ncbi:MAG: N-acetylmuramoyl-L-alanine amidase [Bacteroidia bacterium]
MKKLLFITALVSAVSFGYAHQQGNTSPADIAVTNSYANVFSMAYQQYPQIPRGVLEAVSFTNTHFTHLQHASTASESCVGIPNAYGLMALTLDGQHYFKNNLIMVSQLSGYGVNDIINNPQSNVLAYAAAYQIIKQKLNITSMDIAQQLPILVELSELPNETEGQNYALNTQLYGYLQFLSNENYQQLYGFPKHAIDCKSIFGAENYEILSSVAQVNVSDESVYNNKGQQYQLKSLQTSDYGPALWNAAASCNYSSRSGTAISAVTIHTVQGSYAGCISWFQNCSANVSAHYVVRSSDGQITQMVTEANKAWHVGNNNPFTIGLEHEGYIAQASWYTTAMYTQSAALVKDICNSGYGISPLRTYYGPGCSGGATSCALGACTTIKGHQMFAGQSHSDPGPNWDWAKYYLLINNNPNITTLTAGSGTFYDSGGNSGNYSDDERILTLIQPTGATAITLNFTSFSTEAGWDYLFIYDGATTSAPLLGKYDGTTGPGTITSTSGSLLIEFRSDCATAAAGWAATWTSNSTPPPSSDNTAPTTTVSTVNAWQTGNFTATFNDADNVGGSGLEKSYYQVIDYNGTEWRANNNNGFFSDNFDASIHPDWTVANGTWSINGGALYQADEDSTNTNIYATLNQTLSNRYLYNFYGKIDGSGTNKRAGFHFFCDNAAQSNRGNSYFVWFRVDDAKLQIYEVANNVFGTAQHEVALTTFAGQWYDYKVIYDRITGKIDVYRDNQLITSWTDPSPLATGNAVSFRSGNANFAINELKVYRSRQPNTANITVGAANTNDIRYQNPNPTTFAAKIKSVCADSAGNLSSIYYHDLNIDWTVPDTIAFVYDGLGNDITTTTSLTDLSANWMPSADVHSAVSRYFYAVGTTAGGTDILDFTDNWFNLSATADSLTLVNGQTYFISVKAENGAGLQSPVFTSNGQTVQVVSVDELNAINTLTVYPNPFNNNATIAYQLNVQSSVKVSVTDVLGKELVLYNNPNQSAGKHQVAINAAELQLAKGMYFVKLQTEKNQRFVKIVVR